MANFDENGILIANIIIYTIFFVSIVIILSEIINITKFCYNYTYNYNYGQLNEKTCLSDDTTSIIEYEKARYRIYSTINNYKLQNDLFNKNWINYIAYLSILILTIIICISFGVLFKYYFITGDASCSISNDPNDYSVLKLIALCFFKDYINFIPNCTMNYLMIFIIIIIYPLIFISKVAFKIDYTWTGGYWTKMSHIIFFILLLYYTVVLFKLNKTDIKEERTSRLVVYLSYVVVFFIANFVFNKTFDEYNQPDKMSNIYDTDENKKRNSSDVSPNDKNDTAFFDIYKQTAPAKPNALPEPPKDSYGNDLLVTFKYLSAEKLLFMSRIVAAAAAGLKTDNLSEIIINKITSDMTIVFLNSTGTFDNILKKFINDDYTPNSRNYNAHKSVAYVYTKLLNKNSSNDELKKAIGKSKNIVLVNVQDGTGNNDELPGCEAIYNYVIDKQGEVIPDNIKTAIKTAKDNFLTEYEKQLTEVNNYYKAKKDYESELEIYNKKYNNYKNSQIDFPKLIYILYDIFPKMVGLDKPIVIMIIVAIVSFIIIYAIINYINDSDRHGIYLYNTIFIYLIGIITIFVISNSVLTYNTYFNKYLIYEPISQYKNDINKLNTIFNIALDNNQKSIKGKNDFYKLTTGEKDIITITSSDTAEVDVDKIIKEIEKDNLVNAKLKAPVPVSGTGTKSDVTKLADYVASAKDDAAKLEAKIALIRFSLYRILYSDIIDHSLAKKIAVSSDYRKYTNDMPDILYTPLYINYQDFYKNDFNNYYDIDSSFIISIDEPTLSTKLTSLISNKKDINIKVKTFFLMIRKTFINDVSKINDRIKTIKNNLKYSLYNNDEITKISTAFSSNSNYYETFLIKDFTEEQLTKQDYTINNDITKQYKNSLVAIDDIFNIYAKYVLEFRKIVISLLNSIGYCEDSPSININQKMKEYYRKVFKKTDKQSDEEYLAFVFKSSTEEPLIDVYKTVLGNKMKEANDLFVRYFNIIKFLTIYTITGTSEDINQKNIIAEIINNYNVFNKDNKKYTSNELLYKQFKLQCNYSNKYNKFLLKDKTEQEMNMNNVSWSFVILIIIFAVILIEPTLI